MGRSISQIVDAECIEKTFVSERAWRRWGEARELAEQKGLTGGGEDEYLSLRDGRRVSLLKEEHLPLLDEALERWVRTAKAVDKMRRPNFVAVHGMSGSEGADFDSWFVAMRAKVDGGWAFTDREIEACAMFCWHLKGYVANASMCCCFAVFLPQAVPRRRVELAAVGRRMSQVYYLENVGKQLDSMKHGQAGDRDSLGLHRAMLYFRIAGEIMAGTFAPTP